MKIVFISDTHGKHLQVKLPTDADLLIHAGDVSGRGQVNEVHDFLNWFSAIPIPHKIFIAGNHDFLMEKEPSLFKEMIPDNIIYLENDSVTIEGIKIWGSPVTPWFFNWAFNVNRGADIMKYWNQIPEDTDILVTHGPPYNMLDKVISDGKLVGCEALAERLEKLQVKIHVFGHIHEAYGMREKAGTTYINASVLNASYQMVNAPVVLDWPLRIHNS